MMLWTTLAAELRKAVSLPAVWAGLAVALLGSTALTLLNAVTTRSAIDAGALHRVADTSPVETAFAAMPLGTVGAVIVGVVVVSSEYVTSDDGGGRQIAATLAAVPRRAVVLAAKALTVAVLVLAVAAATIPVTVAVAVGIIGEGGVETVTVAEAATRGLGGALYWSLTGLIACAITVLTRSGTVPLLVLVVNSSLVSVSLLLTNVTELAHWLPDMAGRRLFGGDFTVDGGLDAVPGGLVMAGWTMALLVAAAVVFRRRDA
ncbi:ABC transporter permease [Georgenia sunbinii]|uniref:ABC transporter permease n=1 Tax=Georgenia sunbinii TaxID=3117728 RepID=UPI002F262D50